MTLAAYFLHLETSGLPGCYIGLWRSRDPWPLRLFPVSFLLAGGETKRERKTEMAWVQGEAWESVNTREKPRGPERKKVRTGLRHSRCSINHLAWGQCEAARVNTMTGGLDLSFGFPRNGKIPHPHQVAWSQPINMLPVGNKGRGEKPAKVCTNKIALQTCSQSA